MQSVKLWSCNLEIFFSIFIFSSTQNNYTDTCLKIILEKDLNNRVISFCKKIENKLESVTNEFIRFSKRKQIDPININDFSDGSYSVIKEKDLPLKDKEFDDREDERWQANPYQAQHRDLNKDLNRAGRATTTYQINNNLLDQCD